VGGQIAAAGVGEEGWRLAAGGGEEGWRLAWEEKKAGGWRLAEEKKAGGWRRRRRLAARLLVEVGAFRFAASGLRRGSGRCRLPYDFTDRQPPAASRQPPAASRRPPAASRAGRRVDSDVIPVRKTIVRLRDIELPWPAS
jgi:hypothetical protein